MKKATLAGLSPFILKEQIGCLHNSAGSFTSPLEKPGPVIEAPENPGEWEAFRRQLSAWKIKSRNEVNYDGTAYDISTMEWTQRNFSCYFLMIYDRDLFDQNKMNYTVDKVVKRGIDQFGGYDSIVLWHAYPRIGLDERNQFDYYRDMPGGLSGTRKVTDQFHSHNIKVFIPYCPWDKSTRREEKSDPEALADILRDINGDGIFLDTMKAAGPAFSNQLKSFREKGICLESELALDVDLIEVHHASWAQWFDDRFVPGVLRNKWFEPRHMQHQIARWNDDHSAELHMAWINGSGMMVWENVFGQWVPWSLRDKLTLKKMVMVQRHFWKLFSHGKWTPLFPTTQYGLFASLWEYEGLRLWTVVNRNQKDITGGLLDVAPTKGDLYYDVINGVEITAVLKEKSVKLNGEIAARSIQCFIAGQSSALGAAFIQFLSTLKLSVSSIGKEAEQIAKLQPVASARKKDFDESTMVEIQPCTILMITSVLSRECGAYESRLPIKVDLNKPICYDRTAIIPKLAVDITPVTNKMFGQFIGETSYKPRVTDNFLKHWTNGTYPERKHNHPVVWVDITDARAYCNWAGKRLPTELEWQFIASGYEHRVYPWGDEMDITKCNGRSGGTVAVDDHPEGKSPFGCLDMCGNTWELTESEYSDDHNRFCLLKGGSYYNAEGSIWYTQSGAQASGSSVKMLLMYPGLDRSATIGFRTVKDLE
ncbi:MAG: SUMF1/EgtB/PvdO family nonheme iron enzyme [Chryseolinea sp.]